MPLIHGFPLHIRPSVLFFLSDQIPLSHTAFDLETGRDESENVLHRHLSFPE